MHHTQGWSGGGVPERVSTASHVAPGLFKSRKCHCCTPSRPSRHRTSAAHPARTFPMRLGAASHPATPHAPSKSPSAPLRFRHPVRFWARWALRHSRLSRHGPFARSLPFFGLQSRGLATLATTATAAGLVSQLSQKSQGGAPRFQKAWLVRQTTSLEPRTIAQASARAAPRTTVPASISASQPCFSRMPSAARAFGLSRSTFGPRRTTSRTVISGWGQLSRSQRLSFSALSISEETSAALASREASAR